MQRFVDVTSFFESFSLNLCVFRPFWTCKVNNIDFGFPMLHLFFDLPIHIRNLFHDAEIEMNSKDRMRSWRLFIHWSLPDLPILKSLQQDINCFFIIVGRLFRNTFYIDSSFDIFSNWPDFNIGIKLN